MKTIIQRIEEYLISRKIRVRQFEISIGISNGAISKAIKKGTDIQSKWLSNIVDIYDDINPTWLLTGKGEMTGESSSNYAIIEDEVPLVFHESEEGYHSIFENTLVELRETNLTKRQKELLQKVEYQYDELLHQSITSKHKIAQLYKNRDQLIEEMKKL